VCVTVAERASGTGHQRDARPYHRRHRVQRLPGAGAAEPDLVERAGRPGAQLRRLPVLLQPRQQHARRHQLGRQLPDLRRLQHALPPGADHPGDAVPRRAALRRHGRRRVEPHCCGGRGDAGILDGASQPALWSHRLRGHGGRRGPGDHLQSNADGASRQRSDAAAAAARHHLTAVMRRSQLRFDGHSTAYQRSLRSQ